MKHYTFDTSGELDHWTELGFVESDEKAIELGEKLALKYDEFPCIVYDDSFKTIKKWMSREEIEKKET